MLQVAPAMAGMAFCLGASCTAAASSSSSGARDSGIVAPGMKAASVGGGSRSDFFVGRAMMRETAGAAVGRRTAERRPGMRAMAAEETATTAPETFEVELEKPFGLRFYKGMDGGTYIDVVQPGSNAANTGKFTPGDKILATSAVFGNDMWPAAEYGRTMYTIRQRIGTLLMKVEKRLGKREDQANAEELAKQRNSNAIGDAVREMQVQNYLRKQELQKQREDELDEGLKAYKAGKYDEALVRFETVLGLKPEFNEIAVASYNVSCCYSKLNQLEAGLSALEEALEAGFDNFKTMRDDPDLENLRKSPKFAELIKVYDESFINENAFNAIKSMFGIFGKK